MSTAIEIIRDEHKSIASILKSMLAQVERCRSGEAEPDWPLYSAMLDYLAAFPEVTHHPKEDHFLFARLRACHPAAAPVLDRLELEHVQSASDLRDLRKLLRDCRVTGDVQSFATALDRYASFTWRHMASEETEVLPLAQKYLSHSDWAAIDAAFRANLAAPE